MLKLPAYFVGYNRRKDRSVSLRFETQELSTQQLGEIDALVMEEAFGWVMFKANELQPTDVPTQDAEETGKTPSTRMRQIIWRMWQQAGSVGSQDAFYRAKMDELCEKLKAQLD